MRYEIWRYVLNVLNVIGDLRIFQVVLITYEARRCFQGFVSSFFICAEFEFIFCKTVFYVY